MGQPFVLKAGIKAGIDMRKYLILCLLLAGVYAQAGVWQWSAEVTGWVSAETKESPVAFLWVPEDCAQVRALVWGNHNMSEEDLFERPAFRRKMSELGFAVLWITPGLDMKWDVETGCQTAFDGVLKDLAEKSGYTELSTVPLVPLGHSAMATFPWNFAAWNPERTLAVISLHGDAPRTNLTGYGRENLEWGRTRNIDGIPALMIMGEYEWWDARLRPALAFRMMYPQSCISFLCDAGQGHFDVSDHLVSYVNVFLEKAAALRLPSPSPSPSGLESMEPVVLKKVDVKGGWLAATWEPTGQKRPKPAPYGSYRGNPHEAFWYADEEMARLTEAYYARSLGKQLPYLGFEYEGALMPYDPNGHARYELRLTGDASLDAALRFKLEAHFLDSTRTHMYTASDGPAALDASVISVDRICGPVEKESDSTFLIRFYHMGLNNPRRTAEIWLLAHTPSNNRYKSAVQQIRVVFPFSFSETEGRTIVLDALPNIDASVAELPLRAHSTLNLDLPIYYYVKEGPAKVVGDRLVLTGIPPRSRFPLRVTVVAWQLDPSGRLPVQFGEGSFFVSGVR